jgi:isocitrate dehydrogenase
MCDHLQKGYIQRPNIHECDTIADNCFSNAHLIPKRYAVIRALVLNYFCLAGYFQLDAVAYEGGGLGLLKPPPPKFRRPSKIMPNSTRL